MPTLGLSMIVKDGASTLHRCLESVRGLADTMVIGDTGSTDRTAAIAKSFGATVLHVPWRNDFAAARNRVLKALATDWVLTVDADEELDLNAHSWIRTAIAAPGVDAYCVQVRNYLPQDQAPLADQVMLEGGTGHPQAPGAVAYFSSACCRLFRRQPDIAYSGCVHEMVEYTLARRRAVVLPAAFVIHHFGWYLANAETTARKRVLYRELLTRKMAELPDDPNTLVRYAALLSDNPGRLEEALLHARRAAELDSAAPGAWLFTGMFLRRLRRYKEALDALARVPEADHPCFCAQLRGDALRGLEQLADARKAYASAHNLAPLDRLVASKLGLAEVETGHVARGLARIRIAVSGLPCLPDAEEMLIVALLVAGDRAQAWLEALAFARRQGTAEAWLRTARVYSQTGDWPATLHLLDLGTAEFPRSSDLHALQVTAGVAVGALEKAVAAAQRVVELVPTPRSILRLAAVLSHSGNQMEAGEVVRYGLRRFPGSTVLTGSSCGEETPSHAAIC